MAPVLVLLCGWVSIARNEMGQTWQGAGVILLDRGMASGSQHLCSVRGVGLGPEAMFLVSSIRFMIATINMTIKFRVM